MTRLTEARPDEIGVDRQRLEYAYQLLEKWTAGPEAPILGAALLVGKGGKVVPPRFFGRHGPEPDAEPIRRDGIFLLASITKPITYLAAMTLVERGLLNLSDHVTRYIPEFAAHHKEDILVVHLFTHTSGMPDMLENNVELRRQHAPLAKFIDGAILDTIPLFRAGTDLRYQSMGTLIVAEIVQRIAGTPIDKFLRQTIFDPLGLVSTALGSRGLDPKRLVRVELPEFQVGTDFGWNSTYWRELGSPWGGMFSTPEEFAVICQLMLGGGQLAGPRLLAARTVEMMTTNRLNDFPELPEPIRRTQPWGLGWRMNHLASSESWSDLLSPRAYGHTGATGTMVWIDPEANGFCVLFTSALLERSTRYLVQVSNAVASALA